MKYIMFYHPHYGEDLPVLFPATLEHAHVAKAFEVGMIEKLQPVSAGFWDGNKASGDSFSMGLKSRETDSATIRWWIPEERT